MPHAHIESSLPVSITQALLSSASDSQGTVLYFDANCLARILAADGDSATWERLRRMLGGNALIDRKVNIVLSVFQISELIGLRAPNMRSGWRRPQSDPKEVFKAAMAHTRKLAQNSLNTEDVRARLVNFRRNLADNPLRAFFEKWTLCPPNSSSDAAVEDFCSTLVSHWSFQGVQISELYSDEQFFQVLPTIVYNCMMNRAEGADVSIYRAMHKFMRLHCRKEMKLNPDTNKRAAYRRLEQGIPKFKDRGEDVDGELLHYVIAGAFSSGQKKVVAMTFDPNEKKMLQHLQIARRHYEDAIRQTSTVYPAFAGELQFGWVVMLHDDLSIRCVIDIEQEAGSFSALLEKGDLDAE
jgi:hypothetical protein